MSATTYNKQQARSLVRTRLNLLSHEDYIASACAALRNVATLLAGLQSQRPLRNVLSYQASPTWREIDLSPLEQEFERVQFDYVAFSTQAPFPAVLYDVVLVPLYGFNAEGYRLGHGRGWYDKFLVTQPHVHKIGVGLKKGLTYFTPELHDIPMDSIVTERGIYEPRRSPLVSADRRG